MNLRTITAGILLSLALVQPAVQAGEAASTVALKRLTLPVALKVAQAALAECTKKGIQIGVTVVDRDGIVQVTLRDTIAAPITAEISRQKAFTAANFNAATSTLGDFAKTPIGRIDGLVMHPGGVPIQAGGALLGAVGVSGSPSGLTDEECAKAGVDAVLADLEMEM